MPKLNKYLVPAIIFAVGVSISIILLVLEQNSQNAQFKSTLERQAEAEIQKFEKLFDSTEKALARIADRWVQNRGTKRENWQKDVQNYIADFGFIQAISWVAPNNRVRWIEPIEGNAKAINFDLGSSSDRLIAIEEAKANQKTVSTVVIQLKQGGPGFLNIVPITIDGEHRGLISTVFRVDHLISYAIDDSYLDYRVYEGSKEIYASKNVQSQEEKYEHLTVEKTLNFSNKKWTFRFLPTNRYLAKIAKNNAYLEFIFALITSVLLTALSYLTISLRNSLENRSQSLAKNRELSVRLDLALEGANLGLWDWDLKTNEVTFDARWCSMLGLDVEKTAMELKTWEERVHPDDLESCYKDITAYREGKTQYYENIHRMKHADGHWVYILDRGRFSEWDKDGNPIRFTGTHFDITTTKEQEERITLSSQRLEMALEASEIGVWDFDLGTGSLVWDEQMFRIYGLEPSAFSGKVDAWESALHPEDSERAKSELEKSLLGEGDFDTQFRIIWPDGSTTRSVRAKSRVFRNEKDEPIRAIGVNWDVTDQLVMEKMLHQNAKMVAMGQLAAGVGHEINNPLAIVKGLVSRLQRTKESDPVIVNEAYEKIQIAVDRISKIVTGLRTFSRSEEVSSQEDFSLLELVSETAEMISEMLIPKGIKLQCDLPDSEIRIYGDRSKLQQVLVNLLSNAADAMKDCDNKEIELNVEQKSEYACIKVKDNGTGISPMVADRVFDPFFTTKPVGEGTGIGLSLVHKIITGDFNGEIDFQSLEGSGTTFEIRVPANAVNLAKPNMKSKSISISTEKNSEKELHSALSKLGVRALIVDDDEGVRTVLKELLEDLGMQVEEAENGKNALEKLEKEKQIFDIIITDKQMQKMDGLAFARAFDSRGLRANTKLVVYTGDINVDFEDNKSEFVGLIDGYFYKPFMDSEIIALLNSILLKKNNKAA